MGILDSAEKSMRERETVSGRAYETKMISVDSFLLMIGCIGLALWFAPAIYFGAAGHLIASFLLSCARGVRLITLWLMMTLITGAIFAAFYFGAFYLVQRFYNGLSDATILNHIKTAWLLLIAASVVTAGLCSSLFAHSAFADELADYKNRFGG
jgi:hypothetical protein